jgi:hypothetical protein
MYIQRYPQEILNVVEDIDWGAGPRGLAGRPEVPVRPGGEEKAAQELERASPDGIFDWLTEFSPHI